jgi:hypothetical protein
MTCKQLGGACKKIFSANTFQEIAELRKVNGTEIYPTKDAPHLECYG